MIKLLSTLDMAQYTYVKHLLEAEAIPFIEKGSYFTGGAAGEVPPLVYAPEIWVGNEADFKRGSMLLKRSKWVVHEDKDWVCSGCSEAIEGQFSSCWKCGESRTA